MNSMMLIPAPSVPPASAASLDANAAAWTDQRGVPAAGRQHHPIPGFEMDVPALVLQAEGDRALDAIQDFFVAVAVGGVAVAGPVGPAVAFPRLRLQAGHQLLTRPAATIIGGWSSSACAPIVARGRLTSPSGGGRRVS